MTDYNLDDSKLSGPSYTAKYNSFRVGPESSNYQLYLSGYDVDSSTLPDAFLSNNGASFSTRDRNNVNCATKNSGGGGENTLYLTNHLEYLVVLIVMDNHNVLYLY